MTLQILTFFLLLTAYTFSQEPIQIDMHGGKDIKIPFMKSNKNSKSILDMLPSTRDNNETHKGK